MAGRTILTGTVRFVGSVPLASDGKAVAGIPAYHWHTALVGEELMTRSRGVRAGVDARSSTLAVSLAVVETACLGCRSMRWRQGKVHHPGLERGA